MRAISNEQATLAKPEGDQSLNAIGINPWPPAKTKDTQMGVF